MKTIVHPDLKQGTLPPGWRWVRLGDPDVCELNPRRPANLNRSDDAPTSFVPMPAVDQGLGIIANPEIRPYGEIKKGYTYFAEGDVLFAKITPCMQNGKHAIARDLTDGIGFGSTEFHVIRPGNEIVSEWIHMYVRQPHVLQAATAHFTGAVGQQRVPDDFLASLEIPLPPLPEQKRIAAMLADQMEAVEKARAAAAEQLATARSLPAAYLRAVFDSPEAKKWPTKRLGAVCEIVAKQVDPKDPEFGVLPHVSGENIVSGLCRLINIRSAAEDGMISGKYLFESGDVLYSKLRPYLRKAVVADFRGVCSADMYPVRINPKILDSHFTAWLLVSDIFTKYADEESRRARMPKLNRDQLFAWDAPIPPVAEQRRLMTQLMEQVESAESACSILEESLTTINHLPAALLRRAFNGEL